MQLRNVVSQRFKIMQEVMNLLTGSQEVRGSIPLSSTSLRQGFGWQAGVLAKAARRSLLTIHNHPKFCKKANLRKRDLPIRGEAGPKLTCKSYVPICWNTHNAFTAVPPFSHLQFSRTFADCLQIPCPGSKLLCASFPAPSANRSLK